MRERAIRARLKGSVPKASVCVDGWQHFQERSVVCSPEQSERNRRKHRTAVTWCLDLIGLVLTPGISGINLVG
jgi:hypothetical protein